jgi:signal peptidase
MLLVGVLFLPTLLGYSRYAIVGASMQGTYDRFSAVYETPVPVTELAVGDVITYVPPPESGISTYVTHRIVEIEETDDGRPLFRTKGDANPIEDPWQFTLDRPEQNVVRFSIPWLGWFLLKLADPGFRQLAIGIPAAFIALGALLELLGIDRRGRRRDVAAA